MLPIRTRAWPGVEATYSPSRTFNCRIGAGNGSRPPATGPDWYALGNLGSHWTTLA